MRLSISVLLFVACFLAIDARRVRVRTRPVDEDQSEEAIAPRVQYYTATDPNEQEAEPQQHRGIVLVSSDDYNGLYGQPAAGRSVVHDNFIASRSSPSPPKQQIIRQKEPTKVPPVQTIRNYNKVNDDGSFTFGYEAADGSFKEETRGTDCVVRGKYGYIDPDGNKREFTYVSGNPCDPNEPDDSDDRHPQEDDKEDDGPANYPKSFPVRPTARPTPHPTRPPVTVFQNTYDQHDDQGSNDEEDEPEPLQVLRPQTRPQLRPHIIQQHHQPAVTYVRQPEIQRPLYLPQQTTPSTVYYHQSNPPVSITPRPTTTKTQLPATTYRPQLLHVAATPRPKDISTPSHSVSTIYSTSTPSPLSQTARTPTGSIDFNAEFQKFAQENNIVASTPSSFIKSTTAEKVKSTSSPSPFTGSEPIYASELVYDPSSGQYNTQLFQSLPQTAGEFTLNHRIQPYVAQQHPRLISLQQLQQQSPLYRNVHQQSPQPTPTPLAPRAPTPTPSQQLYQQQQADIQFQNSQQLYAQQQRARAQNAQRAAGAPPHFVPSSHATPQQFYYIQPTINSQLSSGQIDAFLRGHNIQI